MTLDATFRPLATSLLAQFGQPVTYTRVVSVAYNVATGVGTPVESASTVYSYIGTPNSRHFGDVSLQTGLVQAGDQMMYISAEALGFVPLPGDRITAAGRTLSVVDVEAISSGALDALYTVLVRAG